MTSPARILSDGLARIGDILVMGVRAFRTVPRRPLEVRAFVSEVYEQANRALGLGVVLSAFAGLVLAFQFGGGLERFGARQYIGQLTSLALLRELMPVLTAMALGARIAAGQAAELGSMTATEQVDAIRALGADPLKKLVMPRVLATVAVMPILTVLGDLVSVLAGMIVARLEFGVPFRWYVISVMDFLVVSDFTSGVIKAAIFGLAIGLIGCDAGLRATPSTEGVGRATTAAVVASSISVIVLDYLITRMFLPTLPPGGGG